MLEKRYNKKIEKLLSQEKVHFIDAESHWKKAHFKTEQTLKYRAPADVETHVPHNINLNQMYSEPPLTSHSLHNPNLLLPQNPYFLAFALV